MNIEREILFDYTHRSICGACIYIEQERGRHDFWIRQFV